MFNFQSLALDRVDPKIESNKKVAQTNKIENREFDIEIYILYELNIYL